MSQDTDSTAYVVAFSPDGRFLMVYNPKRKGWEMPGGHVRTGESEADAAVRECLEESGYSVTVYAEMDLGYCKAFAGIVTGPSGNGAEMESRFFDEIPAELAFSREEYETVIPWAEKALTESGHLTRKRTPRRSAIS